MSVTRLGKTKGPPSPNIHLGAACADMISVCLTAPDKAGNLADQTRQILDIAEQHLIGAGSSRDRLLMVQVWLAEMSGFADFREAWNGWIDPENVPALSVVEAQASRRDSLVEIRVYAAPAAR